MRPRKIFFQIIGILCFILALFGGTVYPLNTMNILWIFLYEIVIILGSLGIIMLIYQRGFEE